MVSIIKAKYSYTSMLIILSTAVMFVEFTLLVKVTKPKRVLYNVW